MDTTYTGHHLLNWLTNRGNIPHSRRAALRLHVDYDLAAGCAGSDSVVCGADV